MPTERPARQITDSRVLAAMSHPLRRRLLDALTVDGPSTASMLAQSTGQAVGNVSHHLHVLATAELITEAPELARDRRERWWRLVSASLRWSDSDFAGDPAAEAVAGAALSLNLEHHVDLVRRWYAADEAEHERWGAAFSADKWLQLTPAELAELAEDLVALLDTWAKRAKPEDGADRESVFVFAFGFPSRP